MISSLLFRSARLPCFQPKGRWQALMWWLVSATEAGVLSSCIRFLLKWMWLRHTKHIFFSSDFIPKICFCCTFKLHLADWVWNLKGPTRYRAGEGQGLWEYPAAYTVSANLSVGGPRCAAGSSGLRIAPLPVFSTLPSVNLQQPRVKFRVNFKLEPRTELLFSLTSTWKREGSPP